MFLKDPGGGVGGRTEKDKPCISMSKICNENVMVTHHGLAGSHGKDPE
jgi:hypothetical protein